MPTIILKALDIFAKQRRRLPKALIVVFIFSTLFPNEAIQVKNMLVSKIQILLPESFTVLLKKLQLSKNDFLTLWAFLLVAFIITTVLSILGQLIREEGRLSMKPGGKLLFEVNSIFLLAVLIYNSLHHIGIKFPWATGLYGLLLAVFALIFASFFLLTYCYDIILFMSKINGFGCSLKAKSFLFLVSSFVLCLISSTVIKVFFT